MSQLERSIRKLNDLLGSELGRNQYGESLYRWVWCHNLMHPMQETNDGKAKLLYRCSCGVDVTVHFPTCNMLVVPEPVYKLREVLPHLKRSWVMALWSPAATVRFDHGHATLVMLTPQEWRAQFGSALEYPARGYLVPVGGPKGGTVGLKQGEEPDEAVTWEFIHTRKRDLSKSLADWDRETEEALALQEKRKDALISDAIDDACTAFGNIPGTKSTGVSFPSIARP